MKNLIISSLALAGLLFITGCTTVVEREPARQTTTTTEETTISRPGSGSMETQTIRSY